MNSVCKEQLFGTAIQKAITERAEAMSALSRTASKTDPGVIVVQQWIRQECQTVHQRQPEPSVQESSLLTVSSPLSPHKFFQSNRQ